MPNMKHFKVFPRIKPSFIGLIFVCCSLFSFVPISGQSMDHRLKEIVADYVSRCTELYLNDDTVVVRYIVFYPIDIKEDSIKAYIGLLAYDPAPRLINSGDKSPKWMPKSILPKGNLIDVKIPIIVKSRVNIVRNDGDVDKSVYFPLIVNNLNGLGYQTIDTLSVLLTSRQ